MPTENQSKPQNIIPRVIEDEMKRSYLDYAMSVIVGRALPDARDGLKPVHRRILYAMHNTGLLHNKPFRKSAFVVGRVIAEFHPHGDQAVYDSMVRMAQDFSLRYLLVDGQGNFGSVDGDSPAAMRYTEAKLTALSEELLEDINKETVEFDPNFDASSKEPRVLPSKFPNLLLNGSTGIAVGMATNIPPHNLKELHAAVVAQIDNPSITMEELMRHVPAPDFPTGGLICGRNGVVNAYATGRGKITVRAKTSIEEIRGRTAIIIHEIPYMVNKAEMIKHIADLVRDKVINDIFDLRDESDRDGMRVVIELKQGGNTDFVLNQLFVHSRLQTSIGLNFVALVGNQPKTLTLKELIHYFIVHRVEVVRRRTAYDLGVAKDRAHILEGLIVALSSIDKVVALIKNSKKVDEARAGLISTFKLSEKQANAILDMRLSRLTTLETQKIKDEHKELLATILDLESILASELKIKTIIKNELIALSQKYGDERRSQIIDIETTELNMEDLVEEGQCVITISHSGYVKRLPTETYRAQRRGGKGVTATKTDEEDSVASVFIAHTHSYILFFTNKGKVHWLKVYNVPEGSRVSKGKAIVNLIELEQGETVNAYVPVITFDPQHYVVLCTAQGTIKKTELSNFSNPRRGGIIALDLTDGDSLVGAALTDGKKEIMIATKLGVAARFSEEDVRPTGRQAGGVRAIRLDEGDCVINMAIVTEEDNLLTITENGYGKRTPVSEYRLINRGGKGVINIMCSDRNGNVVTVKPVRGTEEIMVISHKGIAVRIPIKDISSIGRNTQGVRIMRLDENDKVVAAALVASEDVEPQ